MNMKTADIEIIADTLSNLFDWDSENFEQDFINCLAENEIDISREAALRLFHRYLELDTKMRSSPQFDYNQFILNHCTF